jgi:hypothetical protein
MAAVLHQYGGISGRQAHRIRNLQRSLTKIIAKRIAKWKTPLTRVYQIA